MILGVDVGGTFTDFVLLDSEGQVRIHKLLTSTHDPSLACLQGITDLDAGPETTVIHGTTVGTNALLERRGARTALIATNGFGDVLEIGRQTRLELYALHPTRPEPLVPKCWRFELPERVDRHGAVLRALDLDATDAVLNQLISEGIESVAICFLFSFVNPRHEHQVRDRIMVLTDIATPAVSLSSDVLPEYREYERMSTTVINAYVAPLMSQYLSDLEDGLDGRRLRVMQSNGGRISTEVASTLAAQTVLSGPAGGVVGAFQLAKMAGLDQVITFDMGGTSTDVSLCPGHIQETTEGTIAGLPLRLPMIDVHTVGAGGGSIARQDAGGALLVGPQSAGVAPGPVCYGQDDAEQITVTDANLSLGRLHPEHFLGGRMKLDVARTKTRMLELARRLSLPMEAAAWGVIRVANSNIERAIRTISVERGYDPRYFTLVAFGGAGPLHACELAQALWIPRVLVPLHPGVLSALGMVLADTVRDYSHTVMLPAQTVGTEILNRLFIPLYERALSELQAEGLAADDLTLEPALDMRYVGQSYELTIPFRQQSTDLRETVGGRHIRQFHAAHRHRFSYATEGEPVEIVNLRLKAIGRTDKPRFPHRPAGNLDPSHAKIGYKQVFFGDVDSPAAARPFPAALYERERLTPGNVVVGPAIVHQLDTTTAIPPGWAATVDGWCNLVIERRGP
jgi:N-methylhydantoinase A